MTKEEEWDLLAQIHEGEKELLVDAWDIHEIVQYCTAQMDVKKRIRMGKIEGYIKLLTEQDHSKAHDVWAHHQQLEELRLHLVKQAERIIPKTLESIIEEAPIALLWEELIELAEYAVYRAARVLDYTRGLPFRTYARWWIRAFCSRYIDHKMRGEDWFPNDTVGRIVFVPYQHPLA